MYKVYVLKSEKDKNLYIGCTSNLEKRLKYHASGNVLSTKSRLPLKLIYSEVFKDRNEAFFTERFYKTAKGKKKLLEKIKHWGIV
jgi:putative endonuclease